VSLVNAYADALFTFTGSGGQVFGDTSCFPAARSRWWRRPMLASSFRAGAAATPTSSCLPCSSPT
jgi:hypothetical protein